MKNTFVLLFLLTLVQFPLTSCQSGGKAKNYSKRTPSNNSAPLRVFVSNLSRITSRSDDEFINGIRAFMRQSSGDVANYRRAGLSLEEFNSIDNILEDQSNAGRRMQNWVTRNIHHIFTDIDVNDARIAFDALLDGNPGFNPYQASVVSNATELRNLSRPDGGVQALMFNDTRRVQTSLNELPEDVRDSYRNLFRRFKNRADDNVVMHANGNLTMESAADIYRFTGRRSLGDGCEEFIEYVDEGVLTIMSNIELRTAEIVREMAVAKAGRNFDSVDGLDDALRLTVDEIDQARVQAFREVNGLSDDVAQDVVNRLKQAPCSIYR